jgi:hypothetical protein
LGGHVEIEIESMWTERELGDQLYSAATRGLARYEQMWEDKKIPSDHDGSFKIRLSNDNIFVPLNTSDPIKRELLITKYKDAAAEVIEVVREEGIFEGIRMH